MASTYGLNKISNSMVDSWGYGDIVFVKEINEINFKHNHIYPLCVVVVPDSNTPNIYEGWEDYSYEVYFCMLWKQVNKNSSTAARKYDNIQYLGNEWLDNVLDYYNHEDLILDDESLEISRVKDLGNDKVLAVKFEFTLQGFRTCFNPKKFYPDRLTNATNGNPATRLTVADDNGVVVGDAPGALLNGWYSFSGKKQILLKDTKRYVQRIPSSCRYGVGTINYRSYSVNQIPQYLWTPQGYYDAFNINLTGLFTPMNDNVTNSAIVQSDSDAYIWEGQNNSRNTPTNSSQFNTHNNSGGEAGAKTYGHTLGGVIPTAANGLTGKGYGIGFNVPDNEPKLANDKMLLSGSSWCIGLVFEIGESSTADNGTYLWYGGEGRKVKSGNANPGVGAVGQCANPTLAIYLNAGKIVIETQDYTGTETTTSLDCELIFGIDIYTRVDRTCAIMIEYDGFSVLRYYTSDEYVRNVNLRVPQTVLHNTDPLFCVTFPAGCSTFSSQFWGLQTQYLLCKGAGTTVADYEKCFRNNFYEALVYNYQMSISPNATTDGENPMIYIIEYWIDKFNLHQATQSF